MSPTAVHSVRRQHGLEFGLRRHLSRMCTVIPSFVTPTSVSPLHSRHLSPRPSTSPRSRSPLCVVRPLRAATVARLIPTLASSTQARRHVGSISTVLDRAAVAAVAVAVFHVLPLPANLATPLKLFVLLCPLLAPFAEATRKNARLRLPAPPSLADRFAGAQPARAPERPFLMCGQLAVLANGAVVLKDQSHAISLPAPLIAALQKAAHDNSDASLIGTPACGVVVRGSLIEVLLLDSGRTLADYPYVRKKFLATLAHAAFKS